MISEPVISDPNHDLVLSDSIRVRNPFPEQRVETSPSRPYLSVCPPGVGATSGRLAGVIAAVVRARQYDDKTNYATFFGISRTRYRFGKLCRIAENRSTKGRIQRFTTRRFRQFSSLLLRASGRRSPPCRSHHPARTRHAQVPLENSTAIGSRDAHKALRQRLQPHPVDAERPDPRGKLRPELPARRRRK